MKHNLQGLQVVWFKRDLRITDHEPLLEAAKRGPVLPLYIFEPALWQQPDMSGRHYAFLKASLTSLDNALRALGQPLVYRTGDAVAVLQQLKENYGIAALWSHQETWNGWTYTRDIAVGKWCKSNNIPWHESRQFGVVRRMKSRDGWAEAWDALMDQPLWEAPASLQPLDIEAGRIPAATSLHILPDPCPLLQPGGRENGILELQSFFEERGEDYQQGMSSPSRAVSACSRISPHLAFGTLSMREVHRATEKEKRTWQGAPPAMRGNWLRALQAFSGRLRWHCHFIQKLEDEPTLEFDNLHQAYNGLREAGKGSVHYEAWASGQTGFPMVDACMRALQATGWINFRMRAMLMSFASYHLWLHWRDTGLHLARLFVDYEPGIHYSQCQMQSGTTGINTIRIYNPIKQGIDHDSDAAFIKRWVPELADVSAAQIHTPASLQGLPVAYPQPIVEEASARRMAADKIYSIRQDAGHAEVAQRIVQKHESRKAGLNRSRRVQRPKTKKRHRGQLELPFE